MFNFTIEKPKKPAASDVVYDFVALGGGPAGLNGALYARRKGLSTAVVAHELGGQLRNTHAVENYLGFETIDASELIDRYVAHVRSLEIPIFTQSRVIAVEKEDDLFVLRLEDGGRIRSRTLLAALGGSPRRLDVPGELRLASKGVSYCATCDAPFFKGMHVVVAGGGNSAVEAAMDLAKWASRVTIVHRSRFRADQTILDRLKDVKNVSVMLETQILSIEGTDRVESIRIRNKADGIESSIPADGIFIEIGTIPNSALFSSLVKLNDRGEIVVDGQQRTDCEGLYAAGDITEQPFRQIVIAAAEGAKAALAASAHLNMKGTR
ncbi:MAG: FAD-dependent oxidoreductase [Candidatus Izemoplasmatales bacterium]